MNLIINGEYEYEQVTLEVIEKELRGLKAEQFAILELKEQFYLQTYLEENIEESIIEYREGSEDKHFQANISNIEQVIATFSKYFGEDDSFKEDYEWQKCNFDNVEWVDK